MVALLDSLEYQQWCHTVPEVDNLVKPLGKQAHVKYSPQEQDS